MKDETTLLHERRELREKLIEAIFKREEAMEYREWVKLQLGDFLTQSSVGFWRADAKKVLNELLPRLLEETYVMAVATLVAMLNDQMPGVILIPGDDRNGD